MTNQSKTPTKKEIASSLQRLAASSPDARSFFELLSSKGKSTRGARTTAAYLMRQFRQDLGREISRQQAVELLKGLAACGVGTYFVGRSGKETRLEWKFKTTSVGRTALFGPGGLESLTSSQGPRKRRSRLRLVPPASSSDSAPQPLSPSPAPAPASKEPVRVIFSCGERQWEVVGEPQDVATILRGLDSPTPDGGGTKPPVLRLHRGSA